MIEKKKRVKALAAERLKAETNYYLAVARTAEAEAALAKERFKHENAEVQRQRAHAKEVGIERRGPAAACPDRNCLRLLALIGAHGVGFVCVLYLDSWLMRATVHARACACAGTPRAAAPGGRLQPEASGQSQR